VVMAGVVVAGALGGPAGGLEVLLATGTQPSAAAASATTTTSRRILDMLNSRLDDRSCLPYRRPSEVP
jgi:hypothetical protein